MERYARELRSHPDSAVFIGRDGWMPADQLLALLRSIKIPATVWMQETTLPTPYTPDWMPLSGFCYASSTSQQPISVTCEELLTIAQGHGRHVGYADSHHFFIRQATAEFSDQVRWLLVNMAHQLIDTPPLAALPLPSLELPPLVTNTIQFRLGNTLMFIPNGHLQNMAEYCKFQSQDTLYDKVLEYLAGGDHLSFAHQHSTSTPDLIPATGFCSLHALDYLHW
jgi:hypothetical protein